MLLRSATCLLLAILCSFTPLKIGHFSALGWKNITDTIRLHFMVSWKGKHLRRSFYRTSCGIHKVFMSSQTSNVGSNRWINKQISINNKEHIRTVFLCSEAPSGTHLWLCKSPFIRINDSGIHLKTISPSSNWILFSIFFGALFRRSTKNIENASLERFSSLIIKFPCCLTGTLPLSRHTCAP